jgi:O-succinylbenzoic acid--CoA ligase
MMLVRSFILGLDVDFVAPSSHPLTKNETKYDFVAMVLQAENSLAGLKDVKMIVGGAKMSKSLEKDLLKENRRYETYGMTETAIIYCQSQKR